MQNETREQKRTIMRLISGILTVAGNAVAASLIKSYSGKIYKISLNEGKDEIENLRPIIMSKEDEERKNGN